LSFFQMVAALVTYRPGEVDDAYEEWEKNWAWALPHDEAWDTPVQVMGKWFYPVKYRRVPFVPFEKGELADAPYREGRDVRRSLPSGIQMHPLQAIFAKRRRLNRLLEKARLHSQRLRKRQGYFSQCRCDWCSTHSI
jgi:hypothetical protein